MRILQRYVLGEFTRTFLLALVVLTLMFFLGTSLQVVRKFKNLDPEFVLQVVPQLLLTALSFTLPISVLVGCTLTYSRLAQDNEITAMRACGVHMHTILWPVMLAGLALSTVAFLMGSTVVPQAYMKKKAIAKKAISLFLSSALVGEASTISLFPGYRIHYRSYQDGLFRDLVIHRLQGGRLAQEIMAAEGKLEYDEEEVRGRLVLSNGSLASIREKHAGERGIARRTSAAQKDVLSEVKIEQDFLAGGNYKQETVWASFESFVIDLHLPSQDATRRPPGMTLSELFAEIHLQEFRILEARHYAERSKKLAGEATTADDKLRWEDSWRYWMRSWRYRQKELRRIHIEIHKRCSLSLACLMMVFLGAPMGILVRHSNKLVSFAASAIPVFGLYYPLMMVGETLAEGGSVDPALAMWMPNAAAGLVGLPLLLWLYRR